MGNNRHNRSSPLALAERAYGGQPAYEKARQENRTKLNYDSWLLVRTPDFKRAFGDWEALRAECRADAMPPVELRLNEQYRSTNLDRLRTTVSDYLRHLARGDHSATHPVLGKVGFSASNIGKVISTSAISQKLYTALDIIPVIEAAYLVGSQLSTKKNEAIHNVVYHTLIAKVSSFGSEFISIITLKEASAGKLFYNNVAVASVHKKAPAVSPRGQQSEDPVSPTSAFTEAADKALPSLRRVNPDSVSRERDTETGEPLPKAIEQFRRNQQDCP